MKNDSLHTNAYKRICSLINCNSSRNLIIFPLHAKEVMAVKKVVLTLHVLTSNGLMTDQIITPLRHLSLIALPEVVMTALSNLIMTILVFHCFILLLMHVTLIIGDAVVECSHVTQMMVKKR